MSIPVQCPHCQSFFRSQDEFVTKQRTCPECQTVFLVPGSALHQPLTQGHEQPHRVVAPEKVRGEEACPSGEVAERSSRDPREVRPDLSSNTATSHGQTLADEQEQSYRLNQAVDYTTVQIPLSRPIRWGENVFEPLDEPQQALPELKRLRSSILQRRPALIEAHRDYSSAQRAVTAASMALAYHECGLAAEKKLRQPEWETLKSTQVDLAAKLESVADAAQALDEYEQLLGRRVTLGLRVWQSITNGQTIAPLTGWLNALRQIDKLRPELFSMQVSQTKQEYILSTFRKSLGDERIAMGVKHVNQQLASHVQHVFSALSAIPHPFDETSMSISESIASELPKLNDPFAVSQLSEVMGEQVDSIQTQLILNLLSFAAEGERLLGLQPLPPVDLPSD